MFPRSAERGSIEAKDRLAADAFREAFPRSAERGSIEARLAAALSGGAAGRFHAQLSVAPLKHHGCRAFALAAGVSTLS